MTQSIELALNPPRFMKGGIRLARSRREPTTPFRWPLASFGHLAPHIVLARDGERPSVDLGYACKRNELVPVLAANHGEVSFAFGRNGYYAVSLEHSGSWCTLYTGLDKLAVIASLPRLVRRQRVRAGEVIGYTGGKLGFELFQWTEDRGFVAVDPRPHLAKWQGPPMLVDSVLKEAA